MTRYQDSLQLTSISEVDLIIAPFAIRSIYLFPKSFLFINKLLFNILITHIKILIIPIDLKEIKVFKKNDLSCS